MKPVCGEAFSHQPCSPVQSKALTFSIICVMNIACHAK
ncbi:hypothetical protein KPK_1856 [Klebsiella variicola]|uniref:Uncharacterized protein n=1 Tax=Klebsiella variicola (strain 342) TaxID=507522 RepID=B5XPV5_KLEV3|nr:hypothetical protein KPK_1856 [Klebsiella variicola]